MACLPHYRLAPEHPYPAALEAALTAYRWLAGRFPQAPLLVSGECAGGGLAVSLALALRDAGDRRPAAIHVDSPFCDLVVSADSLNQGADSDPWLTRIFLMQLAACYLHDTEPAQPLVSPVGADLQGLPPLLIQAAAGEALSGCARRLADSARAASVPVTFESVEDSVHSFVLFDFLPETSRALAAFGDLVRRHSGQVARETAAGERDSVP